MIDTSNFRSQFVSIHTPTKGVTRSYDAKQPGKQFQSTHPRRVWQGMLDNSEKDFLFQSTHPRRVWRGLVWLLLDVDWVSIHTPTKGVTSLFFFATFAPLVSIHTPTKGVTNQLLSQAVSDVFQSTHPRRVWPRRKPSSWRRRSFNPHTHEGCDPVHAACARSLRSFNPHTHEGCDTSPHGYLSYHGQFQSTHPRRVWRDDTCWYLSISMFQSTHPRRVWHISYSKEKPIPMFQSTHPRRVWQSRILPLHLSLRFQSTHPRRVWLRSQRRCSLSEMFQSTHPRRVWRLPTQ